MRVVIRGKPGELRSATSFSLSGFVHGALLLWLLLAQPGPREPRKSIYDLEIRPHEDHLVWYNLRDRLPDVSPSKASRDPRPPRARQKFNQILVAGETDDAHSRQMIWMPEPKPAAPEIRPLPNVLAVATPPMRRPFVAPEMPRRITAPAPMPEAPKSPALDMAIPEYQAALPRAPHRQFTPPPAKSAVKPRLTLPEAPQAAVLPLDVPAWQSALPAPPHRQFTPPPSPKRAAAALVLPEAPAVRGPAAIDTPAYQAAVPARPTRGFNPPAQPRRASGPSPSLPEAPAVRGPAAIDTPAYQAAVPARATRGFSPPPMPKAAGHGTAALPDAPAADALPQASPAPAMAIAGLDPSKLTDIPKPPGAQDAHFSAGPEPRPNGGADGSGSGVVVPGLLARGGTPAPSAAPTVVPGVAPVLTRPKWMDPLHPLDGIMPTPDTRATRVTDAPDPVLAGRTVYTMAIQMPNVTSYSGSWMVWFADRSTPGGPVEMAPPEPLRKVDPKYVATAVADRIQGKVRLSAIIRRDGSVDHVALLRELDPRLDQTAEEALSKWIFQPARRNGVAIDVDAVFEIPFFLAPKPVR